MLYCAWLGGLMAQLDDAWIWSEEEDNCPPEVPDAPLKLGLVNLEGIFLMVVGGILSGIVLIIGEIVYDRFYKSRKKDRQSADGDSSNNTDENAKFSVDEVKCL